MHTCTVHLTFHVYRMSYPSEHKTLKSSQPKILIFNRRIFAHRDESVSGWSPCECFCQRVLSSTPSSEKTTSYRRTNSGGQGKGSTAVTSPSCVALGSQEELYCSFVTNDSAPGATPSATPTTSPITVPAPRPRRNAMVHIICFFFVHEFTWICRKTA